jgi:hypothetical protein
MHTTNEKVASGKKHICPPVTAESDKTITVISVKSLPCTNPHQPLVVLGDRCDIPKTKAIIDSQGFSFWKTLGIQGNSELGKQDYGHVSDAA